jgi:tetratricopeptide (TPR) repeat protein
VAGFQVDYAYLPQGDVGEGQRLSLRYTQAAPSPVRPPVLFPVLHNSVASEPGVRPAPTPTLVAIFHELRDPLEEARRLEEEGRLGEALTEYERVATERPDLAGAWRGLADLAYRLKKRDKAVRAYRQLLVLEPSTELEHWLDTYIHAAEP